jgi:type IV secretory pathway TrbD component
MTSTNPEHIYEVPLAIAQIPLYIPGGARSFWKLIGLLQSVVGFLIALWLIWVLLRWVAKKLAAAFRRK